MSLERLGSEIDAATTTPYLVTVGDDGRPHCVSVSLRRSGSELAVGVGNTTFTNAAARPLVSLVWPPSKPNDHSLIVDATASASGPDRQLRLSATKAVLHRSAEASAPAVSTGESDGRPLSRR